MIRIGQSTSIHQPVKRRKLILRGVEIEHETGLLGCSGADMLLHAIAENILGALTLGDLGKHFPGADERCRDMNSLWMLGQTCKIMREKGYTIGNLDAMIMIKRSKVAPYIPAMREHVARALCYDMKWVSIKATRGGRLGFIGREEGVQVQCVVLLYEKEGIA